MRINLATKVLWGFIADDTERCGQKVLDGGNRPHLRYVGNPDFARAVRQPERDVTALPRLAADNAALLRKNAV